MEGPGFANEVALKWDHGKLGSLQAFELIGGAEKHK
jgi:hypothetical protein